MLLSEAIPISAVLAGGRVLIFVWLFLLVIGFSPPAHAHKPNVKQTTALTASDAVVISQPDVSQVFYRQLTAAKPNYWFTFYGQANENTTLEIGTPALSKQSNFRPAVALVGPGLPSINLPFPLPDSDGALVYQNNTQPMKWFHEPFTDTNSWILNKVNVRLPLSGQYYLVLYSPLEKPGKAWVSIGTKEQFGWRDALQMPVWIKDVRKYHEVTGWPRWARIITGASICLLGLFGYTVFKGI